MKTSGLHQRPKRASRPRKMYTVLVIPLVYTSGFTSAQNIACSKSKMYTVLVCRSSAHTSGIPALNQRPSSGQTPASDTPVAHQHESSARPAPSDNSIPSSLAFLNRFLHRILVSSPNTTKPKPTFSFSRNELNGKVKPRIIHGTQHDKLNK